MTRFAALAAVLSLTWTACSPKDDHPANAPAKCDSGKCIDPGVVGGGGKDGGGGEASVEGGGGDAPTGVTVSGSVVLLTGDDFYTATPFGDPASVRIEGASGLPVEGPYDGLTFSLDGVAAGQGIWATVTPKGIAALPTLQPTDTTATPLELAVVPGTTIDAIYAFLTVPVQREPGAAHVVLRFLNSKTGVPVTGVKVTHKTDVVAYDTGGSWSDTAVGTGVGGYAVVVNVTSAKVPNKQNFQFDAPTASAGVYVLVQPDSVTLADVLVD
jgi:hypothetical protein